MKIEKDRFVSLAFELKDDGGKVLDASSPANPVSYLHGRGDLVPGLERHLEGKKAGESFEVTIDPENGFGERDDNATLEVPKRDLGLGVEPQAGMTLTMQGPDGSAVPVTITKVKVSTVVLDANHIFAGMNLHFKGTVVGVREANKDELRGCCGKCDVN